MINLPNTNQHVWYRTGPYGAKYCRMCQIVYTVASKLRPCKGAHNEKTTTEAAHKPENTCPTFKGAGAGGTTSETTGG